MPRPCLDCGTPTQQSRCPRCRATREVARRATRPHLQGDWPRISREIRAQWVATNGWWCPGWQRRAHESRDLVVDHVTARDATVLTVLCRQCNSRKSVTERPAGGHPGG
jgi:5-methylcytosine-specific restriction endonuclease McrA